MPHGTVTFVDRAPLVTDRRTVVASAASNESLLRAFAGRADLAALDFAWWHRECDTDARLASLTHARYQYMATCADDAFGVALLPVGGSFVVLPLPADEPSRIRRALRAAVIASRALGPVPLIEVEARVTGGMLAIAHAAVWGQATAVGAPGALTSSLALDCGVNVRVVARERHAR